MSRYAITSCIFADNENDAIYMIKFLNNFIKRLGITEESLEDLSFKQLATARIPTMDVEAIFDDNDYEFTFYLDHQTCVRNAGMIDCWDKTYICLNFYYVFYAEMEIQLNRYFTRNSREQWSLLFVDYNFMPPVYINGASFNAHTSFQIFYYQPHILTILHNAKVKYCCLDCAHEWTTARGRVIFQAEIPEKNKHNVLFAYLFTQKCEKCRRETEPSWYLDEATRVMKNVSRILIEQFYSHRQFPSSPSSSSSEEDDFDQRPSNMKDHHHRDLCRACQEGSCYSSYLQNR